MLRLFRRRARPPHRPDALDAVSAAAEKLDDVPGHLVATALLMRLVAPKRGHKLTSEQLYDLADRICRFAHATAQEEQKLRDRLEYLRLESRTDAARRAGVLS